jgi:hypothetical protein
VRLTEDNYADWLSCSAAGYFRRKGYLFFSLSIGQIREAGFPVDKLFAVGNKLVGLQLKAPIPGPSSRAGFEFRIDHEQHKSMLEAEDGLIYFALPQTDNFLDQRLLHNKTVFALPSRINMTTQDQFIPAAPLSFRQFVRGIEACPIGKKLPDGFTLRMFLKLARSHPAWAYLLINVPSQVAFLVRMMDEEIGE